MRLEDLDVERRRLGARDEILFALERYGLVSDGEVVTQSDRIECYQSAVQELTRMGRVFPCACSRADLLRSASAPSPNDRGDAERPYPGTCREGIGVGRTPRALRFRVEAGAIRFEDMLHGSIEEEVRATVGDFVVKRADGVFAYQLAVVVDDALQGVTAVVRGADLLSSTARQIALAEALGYARPTYAHVPVLTDSQGRKLAKREAALALETLDEERVASTLSFALRVLGQQVGEGTASERLAQAIRTFDIARVPRALSIRVDTSLGSDGIFSVLDHE